MAISSTKAFNPDVSDLAEEAFERAGSELRTGNDLRTARRSLNYLTLEWANKGINLWTIDEQTIASSSVVAGTYQYDLDIDTIALLDVVLRTDAGSVTLQSDIYMGSMSSTTYAQIPNKLQQGRPTHYWFDRRGSIRDISSGSNRSSRLVLWPVPDTSNYYTIQYWRMRRMADAGEEANTTMEVPARFLPALVSGLAYHIALKKPELMPRVPMLKMKYMEDFDDAISEDRDKTDLRITPDLEPYF